MNHLALIDIDGVLADDRHRQHFITDGQKPDYASYFGAMFEDTVWPEGRALYNELSGYAHLDLMYLTGRRIDLHNVTRDWLLANDFADHTLITKPFGRSGQLAEWKTEIVMGFLAETEYGSVSVFDDDPRVIAAIKALNNPFAQAIYCDWHIKPEYMQFLATV